MADDETNDCYFENNYYFRGNTYVEYDEDKATEDSDKGKGNVLPMWVTNYENAC